MRAFVALSVPEEVRERLASAQRQLKELLRSADIRWQDLSRSHLTLRFLGDVAERDLPGCRLAVTEAARRARPFELTTTGFGAFPTVRRPSVLWLGVAGELDRLKRLQGAVARGVDPLAGSGPNETFRPHLTLGRVISLDGDSRTAFAELLGESPPAAATWQVGSVQLLASELRPQGARYTVLLDAPLSG